MNQPYVEMAILKGVSPSRVVLAHPDAPEDTRVVNLFKNRAGLKKELGDAQDEIHRLSAIVEARARRSAQPHHDVMSRTLGTCADVRQRSRRGPAPCPGHR